MNRSMINTFCPKCNEKLMIESIKTRVYVYDKTISNKFTQPMLVLDIININERHSRIISENPCTDKTSYEMKMVENLAVYDDQKKAKKVFELLNEIYVIEKRKYASILYNMGG